MAQPKWFTPFSAFNMRSEGDRAALKGWEKHYKQLRIKTARYPGPKKNTVYLMVNTHDHLKSLGGKEALDPDLVVVEGEIRTRQYHKKKRPPERRYAR